MDRRRFLLTSLAGAIAAPLAAKAQPARKLHRVGVLSLSPTSAAMAGPDPQNPFVNAFVRGMRELGYIYGEHFVTEPRGAEGKPERYLSLVADLVRLQVDVIVAVAASVPVVKQATTTIPIVMTGSEDPVGRGYVASLGRPGGNITGLSLQSVELTAKRLDLLKHSSRQRRPWLCCLNRAAALFGRRPMPPRESTGGNCCHSRSQMSMDSRTP
jgi:putative tryptophan/tyrosine transport system substrate-binding protein